MYATLTIASLQLSTYYLLHVLATVVAGMLFFHLLYREGIEAPVIRRLILITACGGLVGGLGLGIFLRTTGSAALSVSAWGALGGAAVAAVFFSLASGFSSLIFFDRGAPAAALWLGVGRIGCALAGCCYGRPASGFFAWNLSDINGFTCSRYPTQLFAMAADFAIFTFLMILSGHRHKNGYLTLLFISLYALKRLILDFLRGDLQPAFGHLALTQTAAVVVLVCTMGFVLWRKQRKYHDRNRSS